MDTTENPYSEQIAAGVAWLDANHPDWVQVFAADLAAGLHMENCDACVLGYVFGSCWSAEAPMFQLTGISQTSPFWSTSQISELTQVGVRLGFTLDIDMDDPQWNVLGDAWRVVIEKRLAAAGLMA